MRTAASLLAALVALGSSAPACMQFSGDASLRGGNHDHPLGPERRWEEWRAIEEKMRPAFAEARKPAATLASDYAAVLAHLGSHQKARVILEEAEKNHPGNAAVASNLGTVYELLGENEEALAWIKKGVARNPKDHAGTEWLHIRILEVKLARASDPKWLKTHSVLEPFVDYGSEARPASSNPGNAAERTRALTYQLKERLQFVRPPEPLVGELLFALGNEWVLSGKSVDAVHVYEIAARYKPVQMGVLKKRTNYAKQLVRNAGPQPGSLRRGPSFLGVRW